jgi:uncharacterized OB-fold protein
MTGLSSDPMAQFWAFARQGRLMVPSCTPCGHRWWPPSPLCPECLSRDVAWAEDSGRGHIWSFVEYHRAYRKDLAPFVPYNVALVELASGVLLISRIVGVETSGIRIGDQVEVDFAPIFGEADPVPVFRPTGPATV